MGWVGAVVAYLALGFAARGGEPATAQAAWIGMELIGWWAIVPLALAALATGVAISLGTPWGLFRHYWVLISLALTLLSTVVLIAHMRGVVTPGAALARADASAASQLGGDIFHPGLGLVVLLAVMVLNVYKPRGLTRYGWRKQREERARRAEAAAGGVA